MIQICTKKTYNDLKNKIITISDIKRDRERRENILINIYN